VAVGSKSSQWISAVLILAQSEWYQLQQHWWRDDKVQQRDHHMNNISQKCQLTHRAQRWAFILYTWYTRPVCTALGQWAIIKHDAIFWRSSPGGGATSWRLDNFGVLYFAEFIKMRGTGDEIRWLRLTCWIFSSSLKKNFRTVSIGIKSVIKSINQSTQNRI